MEKNYKISVLLALFLSFVFFKSEAQCSAVTYSQTPSNNGCSFDYISNVSFSTINQSSGCNNYTLVSTPNPTLTQGLSYLLSVTTGGDAEGVRAWIDYNIDGTFNNASGTELVLGPSFANTNPATYTVLVTIPFTSSLGATRLRTRCRYNGAPADATSNESYGETEDYCVTIVANPGCSGTPNAGTAVITSTAGCPSLNFNLSATGLSTGDGLTFQWESSSLLAGPFTSIASATANVLTTNTATTTYYRLVTTCTNTALSNTSSVVSYSIVNPGPCVCSSYAASSPTNPGDEDIYQVSFGSLNNVSTCTTVASGPGSIANRYSNYSGVVTAPDICRGSSTAYTVNVGSCSTSFYGVSTAIYIDYDQNGSFADPGELVMGSTSFTTFISPVTSGSAIAVYTGNIAVPSTASLGVTRMRVISFEQNGIPTPTGTPSFSYGETEDYCINIIAPSTVTVASSASVCPGQSYIITPTGATSYTYVTPSSTLTGSSATVSPIVATNYTVNYTSANGCAVSGIDAPIVSVAVLTLPTITVNSGPICIGQSFTMSPSGALSYTYSNGSSIATPTANSNYTITGTDGNGCIGNSVSSVTVNALPNISVNSGIICAGQSFTMVPTGALTYTYSNGTGVVTPTAQATYSVSGTDANGCVSNLDAVSSVTVNALPILTTSTSNTLLCAGETATLSVTGAASYTWSTTDNTPDIVVTPTVQTTYTVDAIDANGCNNTITITQDVSLCTGIVTLSGIEAALISVYPNPNNGLFTIDLNSISQVILTNVLGQDVLTETMEAGTHSIDIHNQPAGIYFVKVLLNGKQHVIKLIKE